MIKTWGKSLPLNGSHRADTFAFLAERKQKAEETIESRRKYLKISFVIKISPQISRKPLMYKFTYKMFDLNNLLNNQYF